MFFLLTSASTPVVWWCGRFQEVLFQWCITLIGATAHIMVDSLFHVYTVLKYHWFRPFSELTTIFAYISCQLAYHMSSLCIVFHTHTIAIYHWLRTCFRCLSALSSASSFATRFSVFLLFVCTFISCQLACHMLPLCIVSHSHHAIRVIIIYHWLGTCFKCLSALLANSLSY